MWTKWTRVYGERRKTTRSRSTRLYISWQTASVRRPAGSAQEVWQQLVRSGIHLVHYAVEQARLGGNSLAEVDAFACPDLFEAADREEIVNDLERYRRKLADPLTHAPAAAPPAARPTRWNSGSRGATGTRRRERQRSESACMHFKDWARTDAARSPDSKGFAALCIICSEGLRQARRAVLSVTPVSKASLRGLALLDRAEATRRIQIFGVDDRVAEPATGRPKAPRQGYDNADPWYDGRAHHYTIVDSPRSGTLLTAEEVERAFLKFGGGNLVRIPRGSANYDARAIPSTNSWCSGCPCRWRASVAAPTMSRTPRAIAMTPPIISGKPPSNCSAPSPSFPFSAPAVPPMPTSPNALQNLARPSVGHWWGLVRALTLELADSDAKFASLKGRLLLGRARDDLPRVAGLYAALVAVLEDKSGGRSTVRLTELFDRLVRYRNREIGHGAVGQRRSRHYEEMGPLLLAGVPQLLERSTCWSDGHLVYLADVRRLGSGSWLVEHYELIGEAARRLESLERTHEEAEGAGAAAGVLVRTAPVPLHPLVSYDFEANEFSFSNAGRGKQRVEYSLLHERPARRSRRVVGSERPLDRLARHAGGRCQARGVAGAVARRRVGERFGPAGRVLRDAGRV